MKLAILGPTGRMGGALIELAKDTELVALIDAPGSAFAGKPIAGIPVTTDLDEGLAKADVYIDFTTPASTAAAARAAARHKVAAVVGTTGLTADAEAALAALERTAGVLWSPNFSLGVNVLLELAEKAAAALGDEYDLEVSEIHHRKKLDSPSGTALALAQALAKGRGLPISAIRTEREKMAAEARKSQEIGIASLRGGDVIGEHTAYFLGTAERLEFTHRATSRSVFAAGALHAARWIVRQPAGRYCVKNVLGL